MRVKNHPILTITTQKEVTFTFNNETYSGYEGESIAASLWANEVFQLRTTEKKSTGRSMFCGIGNCYDCRINLADYGMVRACITPVENQMVLSSGDEGVANDEL